MMTRESLIEASRRRLLANAGIVSHAAAAGIRPPPREKISDWAADFRIVPDTGSLPGRWHNETAPYLIEPMDALSPDDPCENVVVIGPAQAGKSAIAENFLGFVMHRVGGPCMYVGPTVLAARDWHQEKLQPTIEATPVLSPSARPPGVVYPTRSRSGEGSTGQRIRFRGGYLLYAGANSAASLRQHSIRFMVRDDRSAWTDDADREGDPKDLSDKRLKTFRVFGLAKVLDISSPKFKGADIDADYEKSDKRRYYFACKRCGALTDFDWEDVRRNPAPPYRCHLICPVCETAHSEADKEGMLAAGSGACWIPTAPDADGVVPPKTLRPGEAAAWCARETGRKTKGYAITGVMNTFERWELLAAGEAAAGDDPALVQPFQNGDLGRAYEPKGEGPAWETLAARRESGWSRGTVPAGVLYVTLAADVQGDGIYWEIVGWGPNKQSWTLDHGYSAGETAAPGEGAWPKLDMVADHGASFAGARVLPDMIAVDSGYNAEAVYAWTRRRANALAVKGVDGWGKLPIGRAGNPEVRKRGLSAGKARRFGVKVWMIGTYGIKENLMLYLARSPKEGGGQLPTGYCHFPADADDEYFKHLVSEYIHVTDNDGVKEREWHRRGPNHWLDCRVYNWALTQFAGLWNRDEAWWEERAAGLAELTRASQSDLFHRAAAAVPAVVPLTEDPADAAPATPLAVVAKPAGKAPNALDRLAALNQ